MIDERKLRAQLNELIETTNKGRVRREEWEEWYAGLKHACDTVLDKMDNGKFNADTAPQPALQTINAPNFLFVKTKAGTETLVNLDRVDAFYKTYDGFTKCYFSEDDFITLRGDFDKLAYFLGTGDGSEEGL